MVWEPLCLFVCVCSCVGVCDSRETQIKAGDWSMWQIAAVKEKKRKRKRKKKKDLASLVKRKESMYFYFLLLLFRNFGNLSWTPESPDTQIKPSLRILHCMPEVLVNQKKLMILLILLSFLHDLHLLWFWFDSDFFFSLAFLEWAEASEVGCVMCAPRSTAGIFPLALLQTRVMKQAGCC